MNEEREAGPIGPRGEGAWKDERERVAERNAQTRKAGKQQRQAYEAGREQARRSLERRRMEDLLRRQAKA